MELSICSCAPRLDGLDLRAADLCWRYSLKDVGNDGSDATDRRAALAIAMETYSGNGKREMPFYKNNIIYWIFPLEFKFAQF